MGDQKLSVSTEQPFETMDSLNDIPLTVSGGQTVYLSDVAKVYMARMMWKVLRVIRLRTDFPRISCPDCQQAAGRRHSECLKRCKAGGE